MPTSRPLVSIGMPVYNGAAYIQEALDSLLAQSYDRCEFNISDNASTDATEEICRAYVARDPRIRYFRNPTNVGIEENWCRLPGLASGEYFMWAAYDDYWSENYIEMLVECLCANPRAVLAAGRTLYVDAAGNQYPLDADDAPASRHQGSIDVAKQLLQQHAHNWLYGVFPRHQVQGIARSFFAEDPWGADVVGLLRLCLNHEVVGSDDAVMYKRVTGITGPKTPRQRVRWQWWFARALLRVIRESPLPPADKRELLKAYVRYLKWLYLRRGVRSWATIWGRAAVHWSIGRP